MTKIWFLILASLFLSACGAAGIISPASIPEVKPKVGETIAFKRQRDGLGEGVVESIEGTRYKIKYGTTVDTADESDLYALPKAGAKLSVKAGDMVAAKMSSGAYWGGAEVLSVTGDVVEVKGLYYGNTVSLSPDKIIVVRPAAVAEFQKIKAENEFKKKANSANPHAPAGYKPKVGERVVAEWQPNSWWGGEVISIAGDKAKIKWGSFPISDIGLEKIMPFPKPETATAMPTANGYVLVKSDSGSGEWYYAQVTAVNGNSADVKFADGKTRSIKADEYIALN